MNSDKYFPRATSEYVKGVLTEDQVEESPFDQFRVWFEAALKIASGEANAFALATTGKDLQPSVRMLLLKTLDQRGFVFFTNYESLKGQHLSENPKASMLFYWSSHERQVRIEGVVERVSEAESDEYFLTRPRNAQFGAAVSLQSSTVVSRQEIERAVAEFKSSVGEGQPKRPSRWGGYRLIPSYFEFWQGREDRLHDRIAYQLDGATWTIVRLWP